MAPVRPKTSRGRKKSIRPAISGVTSKTRPLQRHTSKNFDGFAYDHNHPSIIKPGAKLAGSAKPLKPENEVHPLLLAPLGKRGLPEPGRPFSTSYFPVVSSSLRVEYRPRPYAPTMQFAPLKIPGFEPIQGEIPSDKLGFEHPAGQIYIAKMDANAINILNGITTLRLSAQLDQLHFAANQAWATIEEPGIDLSRVLTGAGSILKPERLPPRALPARARDGIPYIASSRTLTKNDGTLMIKFITGFQLSISAASRAYFTHIAQDKDGKLIVHLGSAILDMARSKNTDELKDLISELPTSKCCTIEISNPGKPDTRVRSMIPPVLAYAITIWFLGDHRDLSRLLCISPPQILLEISDLQDPRVLTRHFASCLLSDVVDRLIQKSETGSFERAACQGTAKAIAIVYRGWLSVASKAWKDGTTSSDKLLDGLTKLMEDIKWMYQRDKISGDLALRYLAFQYGIIVAGVLLFIGSMIDAETNERWIIQFIIDLGFEVLGFTPVIGKFMGLAHLVLVALVERFEKPSQGTILLSAFRDAVNEAIFWPLAQGRNLENYGFPPSLGSEVLAEFRILFELVLESAHAPGYVGIA